MSYVSFLFNVNTTAEYDWGSGTESESNLAHLLVERLRCELDGLLRHPLRLVDGRLVLGVQVVDHVARTPSSHPAELQRLSTPCDR